MNPQAGIQLELPNASTTTTPVRKPFYDFGFEIRPALSLKEVEKILRVCRVIKPVPCRATLISMLLSNELEGKKKKSGWVVYEDSLKAYVKSFQPEVEDER